MNDNTHLIFYLVDLVPSYKVKWRVKKTYEKTDHLFNFQKIVYVADLSIYRMFLYNNCKIPKQKPLKEKANFFTWAVNPAIQGLAKVISCHDDVDFTLGTSGSVIVFHAPMPRVGNLISAPPPAHLKVIDQLLKI